MGRPFLRSDDELVRIFETYGGTVYRVCFSFLRVPADAEDAVQETFLRLIRSGPEFESEAHLKAWLIRVTQNACHKHYRSLWIKLTVLYDDALYKDTDGAGPQPADPGGYPGADDPDHLYDEVVQEAVEKLPDNYRTVIHLFYYEEMPVREIALTLKMSEQNVKTRLSRARDRLRKELEGKIT